MKKGLAELVDKIVAFKVADSAFNNSPAMLSSGPKCATNQAISDNYFQRRDELVTLGLALDVPNKKWMPVEVVLFKWAVWNQTASYTARLTLNSHNHPNIDDGSSSVLIMEQVTAATQQLFASV